jgi:hypothetical protein
MSVFRQEEALFVFKLYCDVCGKEVIPEEGTLSWRDDGNALSDFRITHKQDQNHSETRYVSYIHLWMLTGIAGYTKFIQLLIDHWDKGYVLKDNKELKKALEQISNYIWYKTKKNE